MCEFGAVPLLKSGHFDLTAALFSKGYPYGFGCEMLILSIMRGLSLGYIVVCTMSLMLFSPTCVMADLKTTEEKLDVYIGVDLVPVASIDRSKLKLGSDLGAGIDLDVQGCAKISKAVALSGEQFGSSNISMSGTWATGCQRVSGNYVALDSSTVLAGSGAGNIIIELPLPTEVPCQWFFIKKL